MIRPSRDLNGPIPTSRAARARILTFNLERAPGRTWIHEEVRGDAARRFGSNVGAVSIETTARAVLRDVRRAMPDLWRYGGGILDRATRRIAYLAALRRLASNLPAETGR